MLLLGGALAALVSTSAVASAQTYGDVPSYSQGGPYQGPPNGPDQGAPRDGGYGDPQERGYEDGSGYRWSEWRFDDNFDVGKFFFALRSVDLRHDQRRVVYEIRSETDDRREQARRIVRILDPAQRHQLFVAMRYDHGVPHERFDRGASGRVGYFDQFDLQLEDGTRVRLHQGTVINPTGFTLHPGVHVAIHGRFDETGTLQADEIDVTPPPAYARPY